MKKYARKMMQRLRNPYTQGHIWTILSSGAASVIASVMTWVTMRLLGIEQAGVLSYAFAVVTVMQLIAAFGVTTYHATDTKRYVPFLTYFAMRCITVLFSIIIMLCFLLLSGQMAYKSVVILLLFAFYLLWIGGGVFENELHRKGKQYISGRISFARSILGMLSFAVSMLLTHSLMVSIAVMVSTAFAIVVYSIWITRKEFGALRAMPDVQQVKTILRACFPLFCSAFLWMLSTSMPRYVLSVFHSDAILGVFSILAMPSSLINVFASSLFNGPELTRVSILFDNGELSRFRKRVFKQLLVIASISAIVLIAMHFFGLPFLRFIFGIDLCEYHLPFMITVFGGCLYALNSLFGVLLVVVRRQSLYLVGSVIGILLTLPTSLYLIPRSGITGAAWNSVIVYPVTGVVYAVVLFRTLKKRSAVEK